ncbi:hypothetical protein LGM63_16665 [Burkholderia cepacia]|nr:hypothetical protein [Burkholderia cepacia]MCA7992279.1 hypothetical protein [Burkholderia cepacia]UQO37009.1 hypothetical protein L0Z22_30680 [Burkholderia cepacia]UQO51336.1 hypothetical protein L0Z05_36810 [Burkholderia cepacia]UQP05494.1 hypothetical protein L0Z01_13620 [Burkholderia cepacia]
MLSDGAMQGGESRRYWIVAAIEEAVYLRGAMHVGRAGRSGEAKCFTDVT